MASAVGLLFLLIGVCYGMKTCDGRQEGTRCIEAWGGTAFVQLMDDASDISRFDWVKEGSTILRWRNNKLVTNTIESRSEFISSNGTFRMSDLSSRDSGKYTLKLFDSQGKVTGERTLQLHIEGRSPLRIGAVVALALFSILVFVCLITSCVQRRKQNYQEEEVHPDLTYADVRVVQQQERKIVKQVVGEEVEYSQIKTAG